MSIFHEPAYLRLLKSTPQETCVEKAVLLCRSLLGSIPAHDTHLPSIFTDEDTPVTEDLLNLRGAILGSAQGIRMHAAMMRVKLPDKGSLHIIDWNAAQGFHTIALLEVLIARGELHRLHRVTLIHHSQAALDRARCGAVLMADASSIENFCRSFPGRTGQPPFGLKYDGDIVIHLLPDCLHRPGIDLPLLAYLMCEPNHRHIAVSVNPLSGSDHAPELAALLPKVKVLNDIALPHLTYTEDYNPVSCRAYAWEFKPRKKLKLPSVDLYTSGSSPEENADNDLTNKLSRAGLPPSLRSFLHDINLSHTHTDKILFNPHLTPYRADLAVIRPDRGMTLITAVKASPDSPGFQREVDAAVQNLRDMRRLLALHLPDIDGRQIVRDTIRLAVLAPDTATENLPSAPLPGDVKLIGCDLLHTESGSERFARCFSTKGNFRFSGTCAAQALSLLFPRWHWAVKGQPLTPDASQLKAISTRHTKWITGPASSGKTTTLLLHALHCYYACGQRALIVLPRSTSLRATGRLAHSLFADFPSDALQIAALSDLLRADVSERFLNILVDDAQCLTPHELQALRNKYLQPKGQLTCFANPLEARHISTPFRAIRLKHNYSPLADDIRPFLLHIISHIKHPEKRTTISACPECVINLTAPGSNPEQLATYIRLLLEEHRMYPHATLITSENETLLRELQDNLHQPPSLECMTTFSSSAKLPEFRRTRNPRGAESLHNDSLCHRFDTHDPRLKLATPDRLFGISIPNVILLFRRGTQPDYRAIYRTVTRATKRLIILSHS